MLIDGRDHILHKEDDLVWVGDNQVTLNLFLRLVLLVAVAILLILSFHELDIKLFQVHCVHECFLHRPCWSEVILKLSLPLENQSVDVWQDHQ